MATFVFERRQRVHLSLADCWRFFSDPRNLPRLTPPELRFVVLTEDLPREIYRGLRIRYRVSPLFRVPMTWESEITEVRAPEFFVDEQRRGPYRHWRHGHSFRALSEDETEVQDHVQYTPPFGPLGAMANPFLIRPQLDRIFDYRREQMSTLETRS